MNLSITIQNSTLARFRERLSRVRPETWIIILSVLLAIGATAYAFGHDIIVAYGDAESHLNIAKRVVDSLTPGFAQLGGIWLPLPHLLMVPFVWSDFLWRSGLAGSIISGVAYVISALYIYKLLKLLRTSTGASFFGALVFMLNPNILYLQATPMTELTLIVFFVLSSYYFISFLFDQQGLNSLILAGLFGFAAALSRYDGWSLVAAETIILALWLFVQGFSAKGSGLSPKPGNFAKAAWVRATTIQTIQKNWAKVEGMTILFATLGFFGILMWLGWGGLILGDPLYFTHSQFSAKSQQLGWLARGELPGYHHILTSFLYYFVTTMANAGILIFLFALIGFLVYLFRNRDRQRLWIAMLLLVPFAFNVLTLYLGQSVIFIPDLTPKNFDWILFNARYGVLMLPALGVFLGYLFYRSKPAMKGLLAGLLVLQLALFGVGYTKIVTLEDGLAGLSSAKRPDAERWMHDHYDNGLVLLDDYSRQMSIIRAGIPMHNLIYIGNKPYWEQSLEAPERYAKWIVIQKDDTIWKSIYEPPAMQGRLFKYFAKVYTSPEILIFEKTSDVAAK
jgi:hypothetical protein